MKNKSIEIINQLKRQTGKQLEKEVIEQVKETTSILKEQKEESEKKAVMDELTGTFNRRYFETKLEDELTLAKRFRMKLSLLMIDIDHFKQINDNFGHQIGDVVLQETVAVIKNSLSSTDFLCRYGGEEFVAGLPHTAMSDAMSIADELRTAIWREKFFRGGESGAEEYGSPLRNRYANVTVSIGVASLLKGVDSAPEDMITRADQKLYEAKKSGKNRVA